MAELPASTEDALKSSEMTGSAWNEKNSLVCAAPADDEAA
jgi:hypothetical protein